MKTNWTDIKNQLSEEYLMSVRKFYIYETITLHRLLFMQIEIQVLEMINEN